MTEKEAQLGGEGDLNLIKQAFNDLPKTGFVIQRDVKSLSQKLGLESEKVLSIISEINDGLFDDVEDFLRQLSTNNNFVIWTQGEVGSDTVLSDFENPDALTTPFQIYKMIKGGLSKLLKRVSPDAVTNSDFILGGEDKCTLEILKKIIQKALSSSVQEVVFVDDTEANLDKVYKLTPCPDKSNWPKFRFYCIKRNEAQKPTGENVEKIYTQITSLTEITDISDKFFVLDFDRTIFDTDKMKSGWIKKLQEALTSKKSC
jgi:hypothetical protein